MKNIYIFALALIFTTTILGQTPSTLNYQAVVRNSDGTPISSTSVSIRISILQGSSSGGSIYSEETTTTSNSFGVINLEIGSVNIAAFSAINWGSGPHFIQVEIDPSGGENYHLLGTTQLLAVPYALYAKKAGTTVERDPIFSVHPANEISYEDLEIWRTTYEWGNHADAGYLKKFIESDPTFNASAVKNITSTNISNWDAAYSWGDHASEGYLKNFTESDPIFDASAAKNITSTNISNWSSAYSWGDHSAEGYLKNYTETDPIFNVSASKNITSTNISNWSSAYSWGNHSAEGYLKNYTETDPIFDVSVAKNISSTNISNWSAAYSWGDHSVEGYLKSYTETDPIFDASIAKNITSTNISNWSSAYSWGDHATEGYLKSYTETDPIFNLSAAKSITTANIANWTTAYSWGNHSGLYKSISYAPTWSEITGKPTLSTVATSGNYSDLTNKPQGNSIGDMQYWNGSNWVNIPVGQPGQYLQLNSSGIPAWSGNSFPQVTTSNVSSITQTSASSGGSITSDGGAPISAKGICWSTSINPTVALGTKTNEGSGTGSFTSSISGLTAGTMYHVRAYAVNSVGTAYGNDITFTTNAQTPTVTTTAISSITASTATSGGNVTATGGATVTARGVCWSTSANPTISDSKTTNGSGSGSFSSDLNDLTPGATYHVRAYATNSAGTAYGADITFTTTLVADNDHLLLGNPSGATNDVANANNYLMVKPQYSLSYNNSKLTTNWTCWHLFSSDVGSTSRQDDFRADTDLPASWYRVTDSDFQYSTYGFDRGHMCPSADRTSSVANNSATFLMTNMIPQAPNNNQQTWANLENYCRSLIDAGNELYIISGPCGQGGTSAKGTFSTISVNGGANFITVPSKTWKIIVVIPNGTNDISRITTSTRVIAVVMPNDQACSSNPWSYYRVSVDQVETLTGYDFLSNISTSIQNVIEATVDNVAI